MMGLVTGHGRRPCRRNGSENGRAQPTGPTPPSNVAICRPIVLCRVPRQVVLSVGG